MMDDMEEIWVLYADDGAQALDTAEKALQDICSGTPERMAEGVSALFRAVHTFKGNARVLGLRHAESRAHVTEDLIGLIRDQGAAWDAEMERVLVLAVDRLRVILEHTAEQRTDIDADYGQDLMQALSDKIAKVTSGAEAEPAVATPAPDLTTPDLTTPEPTPHDATLPEALPQAVAEATVLLDASDAASSSTPPVAQIAKPVSFEDKAKTLMAQIIAPLQQLAMQRGQPDHANDCAQILQSIAAQAEELGFARLADAALGLAASADVSDSKGDIRLYEELNAIELALPEQSLPSPRPHDLYQGWCADHAFSLVDALRAELELLPTSANPQPHLTAIESILRRLAQACQFYDLKSAADLAMTLLDLSVRNPPKVAGDGTWVDAPIFTMLETYAGTVELAIDAAREGEEANTKGFTSLSERSGRYVYDHGGTLTALDALEQLHLPVQFLRVMSPRSVTLARNAVRDGKTFWVATTDFEQEGAVGEQFFALLQKGDIQQITSVSILSETTVRFDFLLATSLADDAFQALVAAVDPGGKLIAVEKAIPAEDPLTTAGDDPSDDSSGVSVEMLEMLGEVSAGLARIAMQLGKLRPTDESTNRRKGRDSRISEQIAAISEASYQQLLDGYAEIREGMDESIQSLAGLAQQVGTLQEDAMASRLRPAARFLAPMVARLQQEVRAKAPALRLSFSADDMVLDSRTLDLFETIFKTYLRHRLALNTPYADDLIVALKQRDDRAVLSVTDRLPQPPDAGVLTKLRQLASGSGGRFWAQTHPDGRHGFVFSAPKRTLAMEGMVVQAGGADYVLPVDALVMVTQAGADRIVRRAAAGRSRFLRLESGEVLPIVTLDDRDVDIGGIFVILQASGQRKALMVDVLAGHQVVRLRPLQGMMEQLEKLSGFAVLAGGQIALVLSPLAICHDNDLSSMAFESA